MEISRSLPRKRVRKLRTKQVLLITGLMGTLILSLSQLKTLNASTQQITPATADSFVDAVGVVMHLGYTDTPYAQNWEQPDKSQTIPALLSNLGVRHVRDGIAHPTRQPDQAYTRSRLAQLYRDYGIRFLMVADSRTKEILDRTQISAFVNEYANGVVQLEGETFKVRDLMAAIEGPNEYDHHNTPEKRDPNWVKNLQNYQRELYRQVKQNPLLAKVPVVMPSLIYTRYCSTDLGSFKGMADVGNLHPYPNYPYFVMPTSNLGWHLSHGKDCYGNQPIYVTETGYESGNKGISDRTIAKYTSRLLTEYFSQPQIKRTYLYSLVDTLPENGRWGLVRPQRNGQKKNGFDQFTLTPKPSYYAVQSLLALMREGRWERSQKKWFTPSVQLKPVDISFEGKSPTTHYLLLQKSTNDYFLLLWQEVEGFNPQNGNFDPIDNEVKIKLDTRYRFTTLYRYSDRFNYQKTLLPKAGNQLTIRVPDAVMVVQFRAK